jgi:hypothetical protein
MKLNFLPQFQFDPAGTVSTSNPNGLGYQQGMFSGAQGAPIAQDYFDAAFAGRIHDDPIFREAYNCNIVMDSTMSTWLEEFMGSISDCNPAYSLIENNAQRHQIKVAETSVIPARASGTGTITLDANSHFVSGAYILPQQGNTIVLSPSGELAEVVSIVHATANDSVLTVRLRSETASAQTVTEGDDLLVLSGSFIEDCECPTGQFAFDDMPIIHDVEMIHFGDKGELCGDALDKCQYLKIPFTDDEGNVVEKWYTKALTYMYKRFEKRKHYERLLNPVFGIIPVLKARGMKFTPASEDEITVDDVRAWKQDLDAAGIACREFAIFAGGRKFSQFQRMLQEAGVTQLQYTPFKDGECKWIDLQYCGLSVEGMYLHVYEEKSFSNGKELGGTNMVFPDSAIFVPMCNRATNVRGGYDEKMLTTVYFKDIHGGVWDKKTDSNGVLGTRNTFGAGCRQQEWTIETRFLQEVHCPNSWGYMGL